MVDTTALVGSARVGAAVVGSLGDTPPSRVRVHGACWELVSDPTIGTIAETLEGWTSEGGLIDQLREDIDGQVDWWYQPTAPVAAKPGDYWISGDGPMQVLTTTGWDDVSDPRIREALEAAGTAQATADGKVTTYGGAIAPAGTTDKPLGEGDLWVRDSDARLHVYRSGAWVPVDKAAIDAAEKAAKDYADNREEVIRDDLARDAQDKADAAKQAAIDAATEAATAADEALEAALGQMVEGKSNVFIQDVPPVEAMQRQGVLWIDTTVVTLADGTTAPGHTPKTWDPATSAWVAITDSAALEAARAAAAAHDTAEDAADAAGAAMAEARYAPRTADRMPTPTDGEGKPAGAGWWQYDPASQLLVQGWRWSGAVWERLDMDPVMIPVLNIGTGTVGDLTGDRITATVALSARMVNAMDTATKRLIVTEETILNHSTLIGQTVVDDINVQGKLIGIDGVFTGTVDFENINVTDQVLAERIAGEHIYGTVVEGGEIRTTDGLPGQVILSDEGYVEPGSRARHPGIRIIPFDSSELVTPPGIGPNNNGFIITGGRSISGGRGFSIYAPNMAMMSFQRGGARSNVAVNDQIAWIDAADGNGNQGYIRSDPASAFVRTDAADGSSGLIEATSSHAVVATLDPGGNFMSDIRSNGREAYMWSVGSDGLGRVLSVDSDGVWVKVQRGDGSGFWDHYNLTKTASDSGWIRFSAHSGISTQSNPGLRNKGGIVWAAGYLTRPAGWPSGWTRVAGPFAEWLRPPTDVIKSLATTASQRGMLRMTQTGYLEVWWSEAVPGTYQVDISALSYPVD